MSNKAARINDRNQLRAIARRLGVSPDWHEPDQQDITARVHGDNLDNAGFWGRREDGATLSTFGDGQQELWVELFQNGEPAAEINLATLLAWAAEPKTAPAPGLMTQGSARDITYAGPGGRELPGEHWNARMIREQAADRTVVLTPHARMRAHDGYEPHSHEMRPDHLGVRKTGQPSPGTSTTGITRDEHRTEALTRLADFADSRDLTWDSALLPALVHAVLALTAPPEPGPDDRHPDGRPSYNELYALAGDVAAHAPIPGHTPDRRDDEALTGIATRAQRMLGLNA
jgi:hypothetical protein